MNSLNALLGQQNKEQTPAEKPAAPAKKPGGMSKAQVRSWPCLLSLFPRPSFDTLFAQKEKLRQEYLGLGGAESA